MNRRVGNLPLAEPLPQQDTDELVTSIVHHLADEWMALFTTKTPAPSKNKAFRVKLESIDTRYRALTEDQQRLFTTIVNRVVNSYMAANRPDPDQRTEGFKPY